MQLLRKSTLSFVTALFMLALLLIPGAVGFATVVGDKDVVSRVVDTSGLESRTKDLLSSVFLNQNPRLRSFVNESDVSKFISDETTKQGQQKVVDGVYGWLKGDTAEPRFKIDIPVPASLGSAGNISIDESAIPTNQYGIDIASDLSVIPLIYQIVTNFWWILPILTLGSVGLIALLHRHKYKIPRTIGTSFLVSGAIIGGSLIIYYTLLRSALGNIGDGSVLQRPFINIIQSLADSIVGVLVWFLAGYITAGIVLLLIYRSKRPIKLKSSGVQV